MKYLLLVHHDERAFEALPDDYRKQMLRESVELTHRLDGAGQYLHASPLEAAATAIVVRVHEGKTVVTDGPFIETREQIAGYFLIEAESIEAAAAVAARVPGARIGAVEVRQLRDISGLPASSVVGR